MRTGFYKRSVILWFFIQLEKIPITEILSILKILAIIISYIYKNINWLKIKSRPFIYFFKIKNYKTSSIIKNKIKQSVCPQIISSGIVNMACSLQYFPCRYMVYTVNLYSKISLNQLIVSGNPVIAIVQKQKICKPVNSNRKSA